MNVFRNILAVVLGLVIGSGVNFALILLGPAVIPPPGGVDVADPNALAQSIQLFEPRHFVFPFIAHAFGTVAGSLIAFLVAAAHKKQFALAVGVVFLVGGIAASFMIPAPAWFIGLDLIMAYIPMALFGAAVGSRLLGGRGSS